MSNDIMSRTQSNEFVSALERAGLTVADAQKVIGSKGNLVAQSVVDFIRQDPVPTALAAVTLKQARAIMGSNFHDVKALEGMLGKSLSANHKQAFRSVPFSTEVLEACRDSHILVACSGMSLMQVQEVQRGLFYYKGLSWYRNRRFATSLTKAGWYLIRKTPVPDSTSKLFVAQCRLLDPEIEEIPCMSVLAQAILIHYLETNERLFERGYVRVSNVAFGGGNVSLGAFNSTGLFIDGPHVTGAHDNLGLASARLPG